LFNTPVIKSVLQWNNVAGDGTGDVGSLLLTGTAAPQGVVSLFDGDVLLGSAETDAAGVWTFTTPSLTDGTYSFTASLDSSAKAGIVSAPVVVTVDAATQSSITGNAGPPVTVADGATVEIDGASGQSVTFAGTTGTLKLDDSLAFTGQVSGLTGSDALDLADVSFGANTTATFLGNADGGTLTVTNGTQTADIALIGNYLSSSWTLSSDASGGTIVVDPVSSNNWQTLDVGAGGFLTGIDIAPDDTMVVRTDTYGAYIWNGTEWQQLITATSMPAAFVTTKGSQGVYEIQIAPSDSNIMYMMYEGYVFKSTNKGTTWTETSFAKVTENAGDAYRMDGQKMAIDPENPNVVYVGTPQNGLFVTTNGGATWQSVSAVPVSLTDSNGIYPGITGIEFDPALGVTGGKTNTIFAASYGNGVYESTNGGASWSAIGGPSDVDYAAVSSTGVYYVVGNGNSLWSYNNGAWTELLLDTSGHGIETVAIDPFNPNEIVLQTGGGYLNISYNGGAAWSGDNWGNQLSASDVPWLANTGYMTVGGTVFDQLVPNELWVSDGVGVWNTTNLPTQSFESNTPVVWNDQSSGIEQLDANEIIVPPGGDPVLASWDRAFFTISNSNAYPSTYGPVDGQFAAGWSVDYASSDPSFLVGIADWWGNEESGYSTNGGQTWTAFATDPPGAGKSYIGGTIAASSPTNIIWAPAGGEDPYYTLNGGATWNPITLPGVTSWSGFDFAYYLDARTVTADRVLPNTFYLYDAGHGVYETTNGGSTWTQVYSGNISPYSNYNAELESVPGEAGNLFFTGGPQDGFPSEGFYQSTNQGATWTAVPNVTEVLCFGFGAPAPGQSYPSIYIVGWVNKVYGIWQSNNDAQSWTQIGTYPAGSLDSIKTISGDPNIYGQVYVGFGGDGYAEFTAGPSVTAVAASPTSGVEFPGNTLTLTLTMSAAVTVTGTPTLSLNDGGTAAYAGGSGTDALTFSYTVSASDSDVAALGITQVNLPNGATIDDANGNAANLAGAVATFSGLQIDPPLTVSSVTASGKGITNGSGDLNAGHVITLTVKLSGPVTVNGTPTLTLNDGGTATYTGGSGTNTLTFSYKVAAGQNTPDLAVTAVNLGTATVTDATGDAANLAGAVSNLGGTLQIDTTTPTEVSIVASGSGISNGTGDLNAGHVVTLTIQLSEAVTVANGTPTLTLNDGGTATYSGGSGTNTLTFSYTVAAGQNTSALRVSAVHLGTATVTDAAGNVANLSGNLIGSLQIDTTTPTVSSVVASGSKITNGTGDLDAGHVVTLTVKLSEAVTVANGTPTLTLNDGGTATYTGGTGTNTLTFSYTVLAGQNTPDLAVTAVNLGTATVKDAAGNAANLAGAITNPAGTLQIDTTAPAAPVIASDTTNANKSVTLTGTAEANSTVTVYDGTKSLGTTKASASGAWTYATGTLANGSQTFTATATDAAGNISAASNSVDPIIVQPDDWKQAVSANWSTTADWSSGAPTSVDLVALNAVGTYTVTSSANETVAELNTVSTATLAIAGGTFTVTYGTGAGVQAGTISIASGATLNLDGTFTNSGTLLANGGTLSINGVVTGGTTEIGGTGKVTIAPASSENVDFLAGSTGQLALDQATSYSGEISGFGANTSQSIDLVDINFAAGAKMASYVPNSQDTGGVLTITQGTNTVDLQLEGTYTLANFAIASDGHGGTLLTDPPVVMQAPGNAPASIASGTVLEINAPDTGAVSFAGSSGTLWLDQPSTFTGTVSGFNGQDGIDLPGMAFGADTTLGYLPNSNGTGGTLSVTDGALSAKIALLGNYIASSFALESDNHGGTMVVTESSQVATQMLLTSPHHA